MIGDVAMPPPDSSTPSVIATGPSLSNRSDWPWSVSMNNDQHSIVPVLPSFWSKASSTQMPSLPAALPLKTLSGMPRSSLGRNAPRYGDVPVSTDEAAESSNVDRSASSQLEPSPAPWRASRSKRYEYTNRFGSGPM